MDDLRIDNDVIQHLLFHKSLIDEQDDASRISVYVDLLQKTHEGDHVSMTDPIDRSIAIAFELVMQHHLNPWDLDLVRFSTMYLKRAKDEHIDLITAGRIIHMAWKVLKLQSDDLVITLQHEQQVPEQEIDVNDMQTHMWLSTDDEYSYANLLLSLPDPPFGEPLRRQSKRKVTLIELLGAFDEARKESETFQLLEKSRKEAREQLFIASRKRMIGTAHEDNLEADIQSVWTNILQSQVDPLSLSDLCDITNRDDLMKTFVSILFLAYENKILVFQNKFPYGKIFIKTLGCT
jgi:segregation and condensation protein A